MSPAPARGDLVVVLLVYVLPLLLVSALLWLAGLGGLALALLAVEGGVVAVTAAVRRRPPRPRAAGPARRPWLAPLAMVGVIGGIVGLSVLASHAG